MAFRVTGPITKYGRYYAAGEIINEPLTSVERSLKNLLQWEKVEDPKPLGQLNKSQLLQLADDGGLETAGLTKKQLLEALS